LIKFACTIAVLALAILIAPATAQEQTMLETDSDQGTFHLEVIWTPNELGRDHTFAFVFIEPETGTELEDIQYDFVVLQGDDQLLRRVDQVSSEQRVTFDEVGPHTMVIQDIEGLGEDASLTIEVTPEFSAMLPLVVVFSIGTAVAVLRLSGIDLFRSKG
jgi:hypothetical protein